LINSAIAEELAAVSWLMVLVRLGDLQGIN
jgi:hypothetical protein